MEDISKTKECINPCTGADSKSAKQLLCKRCSSEIGDVSNLQDKEGHHELIESIVSLKKLMTEEFKSMKEEFKHLNDRMDTYEDKIVSLIQNYNSYIYQYIDAYIIRILCRV